MTKELDALPAVVQVFWRPGCPFCSALRRDLARRAVPTVWTNIWHDDDARRFVRSVNRGNETVPTVRIGGTTLTNPSGREVAELLSHGAPGQPTRSGPPHGLTRWASWLPVGSLVAGSELVTRQGHPGRSLVVDALAAGAWWLTRPLRR